MKDIRIVATDLDGTLFRDDKTISNGNLEALGEAARAGIYIVPTTGRVFKRLSRELFRIPDLRYIVMTNGSTIIDLKTGEYIYRNYMPIEVCRKTLAALRKFDFMPEASVDGATKSEARCATPERLLYYGVPQAYLATVLASNEPVSSVAEYLQEGRNVEKLNIFFHDQETRQKAKEILDRMPELKVTSSMPTNLEINAAGVTKANGLDYLAHTLDLTRENVMALGDGLNDVDMIEYAGLGVAMANAIPEVKAKAAFVTKSNMEDGVGYAVRKFALRTFGT